MNKTIVEINNLNFAYTSADPIVLREVSFSLPTGSRCLLVGANGAGKTTVLRLIAGKHLLPPEKLLVLGRPAFHDTSLCERVTFIGGSFPFTVDVRVREITDALKNVDPERLATLYRILAVDPAWRMHAVSDGQRRRVQLLLGLARQVDLLLLDEITTDLDIVARNDLLHFLAEENRQQGTTILYATHILDGMQNWATHLAFMEQGQIHSLHPIAELPGLAELHASIDSPLFHLMLDWIGNGPPS